MECQAGELKQIAQFQKWLILAVAAGIVLAIVVKFVPLIGILSLFVGLFSVFCMVKLSLALKQDTATTILYAICAFIPVVALIALYLITKKASVVLTAAGCKVGLFGVSQADIDKLQ